MIKVKVTPVNLDKAIDALNDLADSINPVISETFQQRAKPLEGRMQQIARKDKGDMAKKTKLVEASANKLHFESTTPHAGFQDRGFRHYKSGKRIPPNNFFLQQIENELPFIIGDIANKLADKWRSYSS